MFAIVGSYVIPFLRIQGTWPWEEGDNMDLGANFHAKLEPFLLMAKSAKGAAASKLVQDATAAPGVYVFSELLEQPSIQEVRELRVDLLTG